MSKAYRCDRCREFVETLPNRGFSCEQVIDGQSRYATGMVKQHGDGGWHEMELCDKCKLLAAFEILQKALGKAAQAGPGSE